MTKGGKLSTLLNGRQAKLIKAAGLLSPPVLIFKSPSYGIVDAVRTAILDWALARRIGITGENMSFSEEDKNNFSHYF